MSPLPGILDLAAEVVSEILEEPGAPRRPGARAASIRSSGPSVIRSGRCR
ncbi:MAG: hypothetical protein JSS68_08105 [Actinobacteria bacterium]|nr:hypothetical protein [Actinomycetota bacterium]